MGIGTKKTIIEVDYYTLEILAQSTYDLGCDEYSFVAAQECGNDSSHSFTVEPKYNEKEWNEAVKKHFLYRNRVMLNRLCFDGHIEAGEYLISVCW